MSQSPQSQNLQFSATAPADPEFEGPPGAALMRRLANDLRGRGWKPDEMENWRDCGWSVVCARDSSTLEISLAQVEQNEWMLQIAPLYTPGFIGRSFGKKPSATPEDVHELAVAVHHVLHTAQFLGNPRWLWDGFPADGPSTPEPLRPLPRLGQATEGGGR